jgi:arylsulfatase A-like enzyme
MGMLWDADVYIGELVALLKSKGMYAASLIVYTSDNGGTGDGLNYPLRGEKHTNWDGGMRTAAFVSGGLIPAGLRGTSSDVNMHVVDWYPTFCVLAGASATDDPPVSPQPIDPGNPAKDIYGNHSYPGLDGVDLMPYLLHPDTANRSSAHEYLVLSKEAVLFGAYKLLVAQNAGWSHASDNGWKLAGPDGGWDGAAWTKPNATVPCMATDLPGNLATLPGVPGQLPCLFDLDTDTGERHDLGADPAEAPTIAAMWRELNNTVLTAYCKTTSGSSGGGTGCNRSPDALLGNCNSKCAQAYWKFHFGTTEGPVCGVPGC